MTLERIEPEAGHLTGWGSDLVVAANIAERVHQTEFVPAVMRGKPDVVAAAILYGAEIGIGPMQALNSIHVVEGRPQPSAELMRALILRAGHFFTVHEASGSRVRVSGIRSGRPETERVTVEWTLDMARAAGLMGRKNWNSHPRAMLMARATGDLARWLFPDVIKGLGYVAEDVGAELEPPELDAAPAEPVARKAISRKRKPPPQPVAEEALGGPVEPVEEPPPVAPPRVPRPRPEPAIPPPSVTYAKDDEPLPEDPPPEPAPEPATGEIPNAIGPGMLRALNASLTRELGTVATREERLAMLSAILGRPVASSKQLTPHDGSRALDTLGHIASGAIAWQFDPASKPDDPVIRLQATEPGNDQ